MPIRLSAIAALAYAAIYFVLASPMEAEYVNQSYPPIYVGFSMIAQLLTISGVVLFVLNAAVDFARLWRWIFPLLVFDFALASTSIQLPLLIRQVINGFGASTLASGSWRQ